VRGAHAKPGGTNPIFLTVRGAHAKPGGEGGTLPGFPFNKETQS